MIWWADGELRYDHSRYYCVVNEYKHINCLLIHALKTRNNNNNGNRNDNQKSRFHPKFWPVSWGSLINLFFFLHLLICRSSKSLSVPLSFLLNVYTLLTVDLEEKYIFTYSVKRWEWERKMKKKRQLTCPSRICSAFTFSNDLHPDNLLIYSIFIIRFPLNDVHVNHITAHREGERVGEVKVRSKTTTCGEGGPFQVSFSFQAIDKIAF